MPDADCYYAENMANYSGVMEIVRNIFPSCLKESRYVLCFPKFHPLENK